MVSKQLCNGTMKINNNSNNLIGLSEFSELFDLDSFEINEMCGELISSLNFRYSVCEADEEEKIIKDISLKCTSSYFSISGLERKSDWQKGWSENLDDFVSTNFHLDSLEPRYFNKDSRPFRLNGNYVISDSSSFEQDFMVIIRKCFFKKYLGEFKNIYEFGCGAGQNLAFLANIYNDKKYFGLDWAESSEEIINLMSEHYKWDIEGHIFDFFKPNSNIKILPDSGIFTVHALEQIGDKYKLFVDYLLEQKPGICIHIEPINELYDKNSKFDNIALKFHLSRNYLNNYLSYLKQLESENKINILKIKKVNFGSFYHDGYSIVIWEINNND